MAELIAPTGVPEQQSFEVDSHTFYGNPFGVTVVADESAYANQEIGLKPEGQMFPGEDYLTRQTDSGAVVSSSPIEGHGFGIWAYSSLEPQILQNVPFRVSGLDRNKILENKFTRAYTWGE